MSNMLAINCDDGFLQIVTIKGVNSVEMCSYKGIVRWELESILLALLVITQIKCIMHFVQINVLESKRETTRRRKSGRFFISIKIGLCRS